jgi:hypothetical protein
MKLLFSLIFLNSYGNITVVDEQNSKFVDEREINYHRKCGLKYSPVVKQMSVIIA